MKSASVYRGKDVNDVEIEPLINEYGDYLYRLCYTYTKDFQVAEEIVQDVFFKFYQTQDQFKQQASLKTYLTKMSINKCYDYLRSWKHKRIVIKEVFQISKQTVEQDAIKDEEEELLFQAILNLPIKYRESIIFYYYEELSVQEIAQLCNLPKSTVKSRLQRGRAALKQVLNEEEWEVLKDESI